MPSCPLKIQVNTCLVEVRVLYDIGQDLHDLGHVLVEAGGGDAGDLPASAGVGKMV